VSPPLKGIRRALIERRIVRDLSEVASGVLAEHSNRRAKEKLQKNITIKI